MSFTATPSQTVGPYFRIGVEPLYASDVAGEGAVGERIRIGGCIRDGDGEAIPDAFIEIWQADAQGIYRHAEDTRATAALAPFVGFGRIPTGDDGCFEFTTIKPGRTPAADGRLQAPHLIALIYMRGILKPVLTRLYFEDEDGNADDPVLALVPAARRATLIAARSADRAYVWNVHMQGRHETVAFSV